jgi:hypothetical protein
MPEHIEVETGELQEKIDELNEEREQRSEEDKRFAWVRYVGLSTAILAVFAAVGALQSGNLVNEALIHQLKASDSWNEYQAARQKEHIYAIALNGLIDAHASPEMLALIASAPEKPAAEGSKPAAEGTKPEGGAAPKRKTRAPFASKPPAARADEYRTEVFAEMNKEESLMKEATGLETESAEEIEKHHKFEYSVALIQVAIAVGAVSALTRVKPVWYLSMLSGLAGIAFFLYGFA